MLRIVTIKASLVLVLLTLSMSIAGCAVHGHLRQAEAAAATGQYAQAVEHYRQALERRPSLAQDAAVMADFSRAESRAAYVEGRRLLDRGQPEAALDRFALALERDPDFRRAADARREARIAASKQRYRGALDAADRGDLDAAVLDLQRAIELDPANEPAHDALESVQGKRQGHREQAHRLYLDSLALEEEKRWDQAHHVFTHVVEIDPNHLPARARRYEANAQLERARQLHGHGQSLLAQRRLDEAIDLLTRSLEVWPHHEAAQRDREQARATREQAGQHYQQARRHRDEGRWDDALQAVEQALDIYPHYEAAARLQQRIAEEAADDYAQRGRALMDEGRFEEAEEAFGRSLRHVEDHPQARAGFAEVAYRRGRTAEDAGRFGAAMLHYLEAQARQRDEARQDVQRTRSAILEQMTYTLAIDVTDTDGRQTERSRALAEATLNEARRRAAEHVRVHDGPPPPETDAYLTRISLAGLSIEQHPTRTEPQRHPFTAAHLVPNPGADVLRLRLHSARVKLDRLHHDLRRSRSHSRRSDGGSHYVYASAQSQRDSRDDRDRARPGPSRRDRADRARADRARADRARADQDRTRRREAATPSRPATQRTAAPQRTSTSTQRLQDARQRAAEARQRAATIRQPTQSTRPQVTTRPQRNLQDARDRAAEARQRAATTRQPSQPTQPARQQVTTHSQQNLQDARERAAEARQRAAATRQPTQPAQRDRSQVTPGPRRSLQDAREQSAAARERLESLRERTQRLTTDRERIGDHDRDRRGDHDRRDHTDRDRRGDRDRTTVPGPPPDPRHDGRRDRRPGPHHDRDDGRIRDLTRKVQRQADYVHHLELAIRLQPRMVYEYYTAYWDYEIQTWVTRGEAVARLELIDLEDDQAVLAREDLRRTFREYAETIINPNPEIGVPEQPLYLPTRQQVKGDLFGQLAPLAAATALDRAARARSALYEASAEQLEQADRHADALEHHVAGALALEPADPPAAQQRIEALRAELYAD